MPTLTSPEELITSGPSGTASNDKLSNQPVVEPIDKPVDKPTDKPSSLDDIPFDDSKFGIEQPKQILKKEEKPVVEKVEKVEEKIIELPKDEGEIKPLKITPPQIDLSTYNEVEQGFLKKMANESRDFFTARLNELKEVKGKLKDAESKIVEFSKAPKIEQEGMYLLDREYQAAVMSVDRVARESQLWENALAQLDAGEKWKCPVGYDDKGNIIFEDKDASAQGRAFIIRKLSEAQNYIEKNRSRANHIASTYNERLQERHNAVKQYEDYVFPEWADQEKANEAPGYKSMKDFLHKSGFGDNILANSMAKMYAFAMFKSKEVDELRSKMTVQTAVKEVRASAGPTGGEINSGRAGEGTKIDYKVPDEIPFDPDAFDKKKG